jgi:hypothetical protein
MPEGVGGKKGEEERTHLPVRKEGLLFEGLPDAQHGRQLLALDDARLGSRLGLTGVLRDHQRDGLVLVQSS